MTLTNYKIKNWLKTKPGQTSIGIVSIVLALVIIVVPITVVFSSGGAPVSITAYNRDFSSGTREAFVKNGLQLNENDFIFGEKELENSSNQTMLANVSTTPNSIGYSSGSSFDWTTGEAKMTDAYNTVSVMKYNGVYPSIDSISLSSSDPSSYGIQRPFNSFWRGDFDLINDYSYNFLTNDSTTWTNDLIANASDFAINQIVAFTFYEWTLYGQGALEILDPLALSDNWTAVFMPKRELQASTFDKSLNYTILYQDIANIFDSIPPGTWNGASTFQTVGSTSVNSMLVELWNTFFSSVNDLTTINDISSNMYLGPTNTHYGSSAAFKPTNDLTGPPPLIGYQSKSDINGAISYYESTFNLTINESTLLISDAYVDIATDAIVLVANNNGLNINNAGQEVVIDNISTNSLRNAYVNDAGFSWQDIYIQTELDKTNLYVPSDPSNWDRGAK